MSLLLKSLMLTLLMACIWGAGLPVSKVGVESIGAWPFRLASAIVGVIFLFVIFYRSVVEFSRQIGLGDYLKLLAIAVPNVFLVPVLNNLALERISVTDATFLIYTMPCFTSVINLAIDRKIDAVSVVALALCLAGIVLIVGRTSISEGEVVILCSALSWSVGSVLSQRVKTAVPFKVKVFWQMLLGCACVLAVAPYFYDYNSSALYAFQDNFLPVVFSILFMGMVGGALVFYIWFYLIKLQSAEYASYATLFSPIVSVAIAVVFLNEMPDAYSLFGFVLILLSALCVNVVKPLLLKINGKASADAA